MNRKIFPEKSSFVPFVVIGIMHSRSSELINKDDLNNADDVVGLLSSSGAETDMAVSLTARSDVDGMKLLIGTDADGGSSDRLKTEFEDFYRIIPSLTHSGLAISNARKEKILQCKDPFEQGMRTRTHVAATVVSLGTTTAVDSSSYLTSSSEGDVSERVKLFDGGMSNEEPFDEPGHWIELRTISNRR